MHPCEHTKKYDENVMAKRKYDTIIDKEQGIIERVEELAHKKDVLMSEISLAWLRYKKTIPVIGTTKNPHIESSVRSLEVNLTPDDIIYLEELYHPHNLFGVMATNTAIKMHLLD